MANNYSFKIIILGDPKVGKTSILRQYVNKTFSVNTKTTIGIEHYVKQIFTKNGSKFNLIFWDIAGQDTYKKLCRNYYKDSDFCFIVFNICSRESFRSVSLWKKEVNSKVLLPNGNPIPSILIANKSDIPDREISDTEIMNLRNEYRFLDYFLISARLNMKIDEAIDRMIDYLETNCKFTIEQQFKIRSEQVIKLTDPVGLIHENLKQNSSCCL